MFAAKIRAADLITGSRDFPRVGVVRSCKCPPRASWAPDHPSAARLALADRRDGTVPVIIAGQARGLSHSASFGEMPYIARHRRTKHSILWLYHRHESGAGVPTRLHQEEHGRPRSRVTASGCSP